MKESVKKFPCPLCKEHLEVRLDVKHGKPYVICNPCGVQMFVRREKGIELLNKKVKSVQFWGA